ncbi:hypothetical protein [Variovorax rhizosphaerae]|uniref:Uncharacterized protein n=1 Tax=Variovorax rhizosphaerae TaxID=1836200 RepID=A0ABU8WYJ9_9BURK
MGKKALHQVPAAASSEVAEGELRYRLEAASEAGGQVGTLLEVPRRFKPDGGDHEAVTPGLATLATDIAYATTPVARLLDLRGHLSGIVASLRHTPFFEGAANG